MSEDMFDSKSYWKDRHKKYLSNSQGVGNITFSQVENDEIYEQARIRMGNILDALEVDKIKSVLELGCGIGLMAPPFLERNINYTGIDISDTAIEIASKDLPDASFFCMDLQDLDLGMKFDFILARTVFIHLVEDSLWLGALESVKRHLQKDGVFMLQDHLPPETEHPVPHVKLRSVSDYESALLSMKMEMDYEFLDEVGRKVALDNIKFIRIKLE